MNPDRGRGPRIRSGRVHPECSRERPDAGSPPEGKSGGRAGSFLAVASLAYLLLVMPAALPSFFPLFIDSGFYGYIAQQLNRGYVMYKEIFEFKFPAIYYIYASVFRVFPDNRWTLYAFDILLNAAIVLLLYFVLKASKVQRYFGALALLLISCYRIFPAFCGGLLPEHFYLFFFLLAFLLLGSPPARERDLALGACIVLLLMLKQSLILLTVVLLLSFRRRLRPSPHLVMGFTAALAPFLLVFAMGFPESVDVTIRYPLAWSRSQPVTLGGTIVRLQNILRYGPGVQCLVVFLLSVVAKDPLRPLLVGTAVACWAILFFSPVCFYHYTLILIVPVILGMIVLARNRPRRLVVVTALVLAALPARFIYLNVRFALKALNNLVIAGDASIAVHPAAPVIAAHVKAGETYVMVPSNPTVYFVTRTRSPYRFVAFDAIGPVYYREELKRLIRERPPTYAYLDDPVEVFEGIFSLRRDEYTLKPVEGRLYAFSLSGETGPPE